VHVLGIHKIFPGAGLFARPKPGKPMRPDWLTGACMAVRRSAFLDLGGGPGSYLLTQLETVRGEMPRVILLDMGESELREAHAHVLQFIGLQIDHAL
jgi:hypothetical protein